MQNENVINIFQPNNPDIFSNINIIEPNEKNQNQNKPYELIQMNEDRYKTKLSLRKKKLQEKISERRKIEYTNNNIIDTENKFHLKDFIFLNISFKDLINQMLVDYKEKEKIKNLLLKMCNVLKERINSEGITLIGNIYNFNMNDFIENNWINNLYQIIILYLKDPDIIVIISRLLCYSSDFFNKDVVNENNNINLLYDKTDHLNRCGYFISSDKYIDLYNKLFDIYLKEKKEINEEIIYHLVFFIGNLALNEPDNQENLYISRTLNYILDSVDMEKDSNLLIDIKIWCLSKFDLKEKFLIDLDLSLKIQKIYIELFMNQFKFNLFDGINRDMNEDNIFYNFLELIVNSTNCTEVDYVQNLIKSNILEFLMDNINNKSTKMILSILYIFLNLTNAETSLLNRLINIGLIQFFKNIFSDKTLDKEIYNVAIISINNLLNEPQLWNKVLLDGGILKIFCVWLKDKNIDANFFNEICFGIYSVLPFCNKENLEKILDEYFIIQLTCEAMKNILLNDKNICPEYFGVFISLINQILMNVDNDYNLKENILVKFGSVNGIEIIEQIISRLHEVDYSTFTNKEIEDIKKTIELAELIRNNFNKV
jgi:hypothetical protein